MFPLPFTRRSVAPLISRSSSSSSSLRKPLSESSLGDVEGQSWCDIAVADLISA